MNIVLDIILSAILIISFIVGYQKGFVKFIWKIAALIITIVLVLALKNPAVEFLNGTKMAETISIKISETVKIPQGGGVNIAENLNLPKFLQGEVNNQIQSTNTPITSINDTVTQSLTGVFITIIACIALFILIRLVLMAVFMIINGITKAPIIKGVNKLAGGIMAIVNSILLIFILLALFSLFAPAESAMFEVINSTYIVKYFYNYNILLQLFMKI